MLYPQLLNSSLSPLPSLLHSLALLFPVFLVWGGMLTCTFKGLWQVCEQKIVPKPLTKVSLNSGALPATMNNTGYICGTPVPQQLGVLHGENKLRNATVPPLGWQGNRTNNKPSFLWAHEVKWAGNLSGVEFSSKVAEDAWGDLWGFLDSCEEVDSVAGSAERSAFWLTRRRGGLRGNRAIPEVRGECWRCGNWFQLEIPVASVCGEYVNRN